MPLPIGRPRIRTPRGCGLLVAVAAATALLIPLGAAVAAPAARAASLPLVWSDAYATAARDGFTAVATGPDGAVYAAGFEGAKVSGRNGKLLLAKYVDTGATMTRAWVRTYTRAGINGASASKVAVDPAGDVIVAGTLGVPSLTGKGSDIVVLKYSAAGDFVWKTTYDGPAHREDYVKGLALDAHGNAVVVGASVGIHTGRDYVTLKVRASGSRDWVRRYAGPSDFDEARGVTVDASGNVYVTGEARAKSLVPGKSGLPRAATISYSSSGARRWLIVDKRGRATAGAAVMYCGVPGARGVVFSGWRYSGRSANGTFFAKYAASDGGRIWSRTLTGDADSNAWPVAAGLDGDGAPIAAGTSNMSGGIQGYIAGVSASGGDAWHSVYSSEFGNPDNPGWAEFDAIAVSSGGGLLAGGWTQAADVPPESFDHASAFVVRYSPVWPVTAPLDYVGAGSATSESKCTAVAIGAHGMYAVGQETGAAADVDAVLLKF